MHYHEDNLFYEVKEAMIMCASNADALQLADEYPNMTRFLNNEYRYYLYTVNCRRNNKFPHCPQLLEVDHN